MGMRGLRIAAATVVCVFGTLVAGTSSIPVGAANTNAAARLGQVRYIKGGLSVTPPHHRGTRGKVKMPVYSQYGLQTKTHQRASVGFKDKSVLHMNQSTNVVLRSAHLSYVQKGEVYQSITPGSDHRVQTASAIASAIGTKFDVRVKQGGATEVIVAQGAVEVSNQRGKVMVKTNQETVVQPNHKPGKPTSIDAATATKWTSTIPTPQLAENIALDVNGGATQDVSSQRSGGPVGNIDDGRLDTSWESAPGAVTNQHVTLGFDGSKIFMVTGVLIDGSASGKASPQTDLKDFSIGWNNPQNTGNNFNTLVTGTLKQKQGLQWFPFSRPFPTRYLQLIAKDNYGSNDGISVAEVEVVGQPFTGHNFDFPTGIAIDPKGRIDAVDQGFGFIQRLSPDGKLLATMGTPGQQQGQLDQANGLAVDPSGNIYVASQRGWVDKFSPEGKPLLRFGSPGNGPGQFAAPKGIATDAQSNVYVADSNNGRIEKFSPNGQFIAQFGGPATRPALFPGGPVGIAVDGAGNIYATEPYTNHVHKLSPTGQEVALWGTSGHGPGQYSAPGGIALDSQGNIYIADSQNNRIQKLRPDGTYVTSWSTPGATPNAPVRPQFLAVDAQGNVYVTTGVYGQVVQKYSPDGKLLATWQ